MSKTPVMVATVNADTKRREVAVVVEHADHQSFTRAVFPRARKAMKGWVSESIMFGLPYAESANLEVGDVRDMAGRSVSIFHFTY